MAETWHYDDGGRRTSGRRGDTGDCVVRAIAIAAELPYDRVYNDLAKGMQAKGNARSARNGVARSVYEPYLISLGFTWHPTMQIGQGCKVHLRADELPSGRIICRLSKHVVAVIDGTIRDIFDPSRDGTRCVYGYFTR